MTNNNYIQEESYSDGKYRFVNLTSGDSKLRRVVCDIEGICLIPFDTNGNGKVRHIYLARYVDYMSGDQGHTCITSDFKDHSDTVYEELHELINGELGIDLDVNDLYFLGNVKHTMPFTKVYKCYAINMDNYAKDLNGFTLDMSDEENSKRLYTLDKIKLTRALKGDIEDSLTMSSVLLLTSYMD
jgi:hypothetical protein